MAVNYSVTALRSYHDYYRTIKEAAAVNQKRSSGLRINRAADDAAGLAVSQQMRAQIRGLDQAARNTQDAHSLMTVADGALGEIQSILHRMRELAVQAANGTYTADDRAQIQKETDALKQALDQIVSAAQFNRRNLLDGSSAAYISADRFTASAVIQSGITVSGAGAALMSGGNYRVEITADPGRGQVQKTHIMNLAQPRQTPEPADPQFYLIPPTLEWSVDTEDYSIWATNSIIQTADGGYIASGYKSVGGGTVGAIIKLSAEGAVLWEKDAPERMFLQLTADGGFVGTSLRGNSVRKFDAAGNMIWEQTMSFNFDVASEEPPVQQTADGGYICIGNGNVVKLDADGNVVWGKTYGAGDCVQLAADGGYFIAGTSDNYPRDYYAAKLDADGAILWEKTYGGNGSDLVYSLDATEDGGCFLAGFTTTMNNGDVSGNHGGYNGEDMWVVKLDASGNMEWQKALGGASLTGNTTDGGRDRAYTAQQTADGGYIVAGFTISDDGDVSGDVPSQYANGQRAWIVKLDGTGNLIWQQLLDEGTVWFIRQTSDGGYIASVNYKIIKLSYPEAEAIAEPPIKLTDFREFWEGGHCVLETPQTLTLLQGDGRQTSITLNGADTVDSFLAKLNAAIGQGLGQDALPDDADAGANRQYAGFVSDETRQTASGTLDFTPESVPGTFVIRSALAGKAGEITFAGDERLLRALGLSVMVPGEETIFEASVYEAHTGAVIAENIKTAGAELQGVVRPWLDIRFDPGAATAVQWDEAARSFKWSPASEKYTIFVHIQPNALIFHIGANPWQDIAAAFGCFDSEALGVHRVFVLDRALAGEALSIIDTAAGKVSAARSVLGALRNRLEHAAENLAGARADLTASMSRIQDADMAKETLKAARLFILSRSSLAMLAQIKKL
jgi:flagellin